MSTGFKMIIVYQEKGRYESPKNMVIDHVCVSQFNNNEAKYLDHIKQSIRSNIWVDAHSDTKYQHGNDIEKYPLPTIVNIIQC